MSQALYDLPEGWEWKRLKDVAFSIRNTVEPLENHLYHYVGLENIQSNTGVLIDFMPTDGKDISSTKVAFKKDSVLFGKLRPYLNKVYVAEFDGIATTEIIPFQCTDSLSPKFLAHYMRTDFFISWAMANCSGARMPRATSKFFDELAYVPLPPLAEQTRIVEKLDAVLSRIDTAINELQQSLALVDAMFKSGLDKAFNPLCSPTNEAGLYDLPDGWGWKTVDELCTKITDGTHSTPTYTDSGVPFLSVKDITKGFIDFSNTKFISEEEHKNLFKRCNPEFNDILYTKVGTTGIAKVVDVNNEFSLFVSVALLKPRKEVIESKFFEYILNSPLCYSQACAKTRGVANRNLVLKDIKSICVVVPSLESQQQLVESLDALNDKTTQLKTELTAKIGMFNQLKASVLDGAFRGEV